MSDIHRANSESTDDEHKAAVTQGRMFAGLTTFAVIAAVIYGFLSHEPAGTTLLLLTGGLTGLCGIYITWNRRPAPSGHVAIGDNGAQADADEPWFPHASPWPFAIAVSAVLAANAVLVGVWLLLPAGVLLAASIAGFAAQSRHRN